MSSSGRNEKVLLQDALPTTATNNKLQESGRRTVGAWSPVSNGAASSGSKGRALIALIALASLVCWHGWMQHVVSSTWTSEFGINADYFQILKENFYWLQSNF